MWHTCGTDFIQYLSPHCRVLESSSPEITLPPLMSLFKTLAPTYQAKFCQGQTHHNSQAM